MAKIKGIEIKNEVKFRGHEQEPLVQGDIYYNGKKVGFFSEDAWGGCSLIQFDRNCEEIEREIIVKAKEYCSEHKELFTYGSIVLDSLEDFFARLVFLFELEKDYKKAVKKGYHGILYYEEKKSHLSQVCYYSKGFNLTKWLNQLPVQIANMEIYNNLEQFIIE